MSYKFPKTLLLVVDAQAEMWDRDARDFDPDYFAMVQKRIASILNWTRKNQVMPIAHLAILPHWEMGPMSPYDHWQRHSRINYLTGCSPHESEHVMLKCESSGFCGTGLHEYLQSNEINTLLMVGWCAGDCVKATALNGLMLGYNVHVIGSAVGSRNKSTRDDALEEMRLQQVKISTVGMQL